MYLISILLIFIEATMLVKLFSLAVTLSFLTFLIYRNSKMNFVYVLIMAQIFALQNNQYLYILLLIIVYYVVFHIVFIQMTYSKENIMILTIIQMSFMALFFSSYLTLTEYILNAVGLIIWNYIFVRRLRGKVYRNENKKQ